MFTPRAFAEHDLVWLDRDPRAVYWRQMRNGMWIRAALIATIFKREGMIHAYAEQMGIDA